MLVPVTFVKTLEFPWCFPHENTRKHEKTRENDEKKTCFLVFSRVFSCFPGFYLVSSRAGDEGAGPDTPDPAPSSPDPGTRVEPGYPTLPGIRVFPVFPGIPGYSRVTWNPAR